MQHLEQDETLLHVVDDVGNDEEEVEIFPARSSSSTRVSVHSSDRLSLTPLAQRRCVSKEMLEQMPTLSIDARYHDVAVCKPFGCFYLMQLIEKSIQVGALFSPKLYVPKEVWQQDRVRLAGISLKVEVFHQLKQGLERISHALPILSDSANAAFVKELDALLELAGQERMHLTRLFPFLPQDKSDLTPQMRRRASSSEVEVGSTETSSSGIYIGKLTNLAFGFGRMVKKQAISAVERVGAAPIISVSIHELDEYAAVLCMFFNSTRSIGTTVLRLTGATIL
ncbi:hypothetical protein CCR75_008939 [Bremia lactucae]|uniref:Uncharacterized protein n=1 Tax=Bremia lactucae TaxID=4779 RepID=A0A976NZ96_BRELC|nr:hypothetical protein CCR75_008939 [Bremia lactucae]